MIFGDEIAVPITLIQDWSFHATQNCSRHVAFFFFGWSDPGGGSFKARFGSDSEHGRGHGPDLHRRGGLEPKPFVHGGGCRGSHGTGVVAGQQYSAADVRTGRIDRAEETGYSRPRGSQPVGNRSDYAGAR